MQPPSQSPAPPYLKPSNSLTLWVTNTKFHRFIRHGIEGLMQFNLCEFEIVLIMGIYEDEADILTRLIEVSDWKLSCLPICNQLPVIAEHCGSINRWSISQRHFHSKQVALSQLASRQMLKQISNETFVWLKHNMGGVEGVCWIIQRLIGVCPLSLIWWASISTGNHQFTVRSKNSNWKCAFFLLLHFSCTSDTMYELAT